MFRTTDMVLIAVMVSAAAFTYTTKHAAEAELSRLRKIEQAIRFEKETIDVLKADWALLTQPARLQRLADTFGDQLQLVPVEPHQIAEIDEVPMRALQIEDLLDGTVAGEIDATTTGGVNR